VETAAPPSGRARVPWNRLAAGFFALIGLLLVLTINRDAAYQLIDSDEGYNLGIAYSLGTDFCYCTWTAPSRIFPAEGSTNGPALYAAAFFFATAHNPDAAVRGSATIAAVLLVVALFVLEPWLIVIAMILYHAWPAVHNLSVSFFGEMWAIAFAILGIALFRRIAVPADLRRLIFSKSFLGSCLCFACAMESKLLASATVITTVFALAYERGSGPAFGLPAWPARLVRSVAFWAMSMAGALAVLFLLVAFSVAHSTHHPFDVAGIYQAFHDWVMNMFAQGSASASNLLGDFTTRIAHFSRPSFLIFPLIAALILLCVNWTYVFFITIAIAMWVKVGANEDHIAIAFYVLTVLGALESRTLVQRVAQRLRQPLWPAETVLAAAGLVLTFMFIIPLSALADWPTQPIPTFDERRYIATGHGAYHYSQQLVDAIRRQQYVAVSGWWDFPSMYLREHLHFYDRTWPGTTLLPKDRVALLFDSSNAVFPITSIKENCGSIIYQEATMVLCHVHPGRDTTFQLHTVADPDLPTQGPNLLTAAPSLQAENGWVTTPSQMSTDFKPGDSNGIAVHLNNSIGAFQAYRAVHTAAGKALVVSGTITVSGAAIPGLGGVSVLYLDANGNAVGGDGVDYSDDPGAYPFAFQVTAPGTEGKVLLFVHTQDVTNDQTVIGLRGLKVAELAPPPHSR
jgi:hypothetical protein